MPVTINVGGLDFLCGDRPTSNAGTIAIQDDHTLSWGFTQYEGLAKADGTAQGTIDWVRYSVQHLIKALGDVPLLSIIPYEMAGFKIYLGQRQCWSDHPLVKKTKPKPLSPSSVNNYLRGVKDFYYRLAEAEIIPYNPIAGCRVRRPPETNPPTLKQEQMKQLLAQPDLRRPQQFRDWVMMLLMFDSKCRVTELCNATMNNLSLDGDHGSFIVIGKGGRRLVYYFHREGIKALLRYLRVRPQPAPGVDNVFLTFDGRPLNRRRVEANMKRYAKKAGLTGIRVSPHTLRHSGAREHLRAGGNLATLQIQLNHRDIKSTMIYGKLGPSEAERAQSDFSPLNRLGVVSERLGTRSKRRTTWANPNVARLERHLTAAIMLSLMPPTTGPCLRYTGLGTGIADQDVTNEDFVQLRDFLYH